MEFNVNEILDKVMDQLQKEVKTDTIIGDEFQLGEYKVVPIMKVGMGFGGGGGSGVSNKSGKGSGGGAGAAFGIAPVGFLVTKGDEIQILPAQGSKGLAVMFEKIPDVLEKAVELKYGKKEEEEDKEETDTKKK